MAELKKSKILITAGNTWTPIDDVRVITNIFSGETGLQIARQLAKKGFLVTLLLADVRINIEPFMHKNLTIKRTLTFSKLYSRLKTCVCSGNYAMLIQAAAISDFEIKKTQKGKLDSSKKLTLKLTPTPKIIGKVKKWSPNIKLISFKLEAAVKKKELIQLALQSKKQAQATLTIANTLPTKKKHTFYIVKNAEQIRKVVGKKQLAKRLASIIDDELK